jgi:glutathione S-transferase
MTPALVLHALPPSHPCMTAEAALQLKNLPYERVDLSMTGGHPEAMQEIYGEGNSTVPGMLVDGEPVHGSRAILARLEEIAPEPSLYPSDEVREAERWGDEELQDLGRRLPWGALHFRPELLLAAVGGGEPLDGKGTDYAIRYIHAAWGYHRITAERLAEDLTGLPEKLAHIESLAQAGTIGGEIPNAADLQIGATIRVLLRIADLAPLLSGTAGERIARSYFPATQGEMPAGTYPAGWVPQQT